MHHIRLIFAASLGLANTSTTSPHETPLARVQQAGIPKLEVIPVQLEWPTRQQVVEADVAKFRREFARRVQANDYSSKWNKCFSTTSAEYNPADAKALRANSIRYQKTGHFTEKEMIVVIDAGHGHEVGGSYDPGTTHGSLHEAKMVDPIVTKIKAKLESEGIIVVLTRSPLSEGYSLAQNTSKFRNQKVALQIRAEMASYIAEKHPDAEVVFASFHIDTGASGSGIYYYAPYRGGPTDSPESKRLATTINAHYRLRPGAPGYALSNDYAVTRCQIVPSILAELGSINVEEDRKALMNSEAISTQIVNGFKAYFEESYRARAVYAENQKWTKPVESIVFASNEPQ